MPGPRLWSANPLRGPLFRSSTGNPALRSFFTSSQTSARPTTLSQPLSRTRRLPFLSEQPLPSRRFRTPRFKSDKATSSQSPDPTPHLGSPEPTLSVSQRLKKLSRDYGWAAFGVYMALTALDFPFCFLAVRGLGTERIAHYEHVVIESVMNVVRIPFPNVGKKELEEVAPTNTDIAEATAREGELGWAGGIDEAQARNQGAGASIWTQLALAYAIHKSFIFIRVPLAVSITPKVVKYLRKRGWNIGKRKPSSS